MTGEVPAPAWSVCSPGRGPEIRPCYLMRPAGRLAARTVPIGKARCLGGGLASTIGTLAEAGILSPSGDPQGRRAQLTRYLQFGSWQA